MYEVRIRIDTRMLEGTMAVTSIALETIQELTGAAQPTVATAVELGMALAFSRFLRDVVAHMETSTARSDTDPSWEAVVEDMRNECLTKLQEAAGDYTRDVLLNDSPSLTPDSEFIDWNTAFRHLIKGDEA